MTVAIGMCCAFAIALISDVRGDVLAVEHPHLDQPVLCLPVDRLLVRTVISVPSAIAFTKL